MYKLLNPKQYGQKQIEHLDSIDWEALNDFYFDEETHSYFIEERDGYICNNLSSCGNLFPNEEWCEHCEDKKDIKYIWKQIPSSTQIASTFIPYSDVVIDEYSYQGKKKGSILHRAIEGYVKTGIKTQLNEEMERQFQGFLQYHNKLIGEGWEIVKELVEKPQYYKGKFYDDEYEYGFTPDLIYKNKIGSKYIVDIKTGNINSDSYKRAMIQLNLNRKQFPTAYWVEILNLPKDNYAKVYKVDEMNPLNTLECINLKHKDFQEELGERHWLSKTKVVWNNKEWYKENE